MSRRLALPAIALATIIATAVPSTAQIFGQRDLSPCGARGLQNTVDLLLPRLRENVDIRDLSCNGLSQVYRIVTRPERVNTGNQRREILAVFRREGKL